MGCECIMLTLSFWSSQRSLGLFLSFMSETEILFTYKMINTCQCEMAADIFCIDFSTGLNSPIADAHCVHLNKSCYLKFRLYLHAKKIQLTNGFQTGVYRPQWGNVKCNDFKPEIITEENFKNYYNSNQHKTLGCMHSQIAHLYL